MKTRRLNMFFPDYEGIVTEGYASVNGDGELSVSLVNLKNQNLGVLESPKLYDSILHAFG